MSDPREYQTEAVVIKKTKLGEADSILTLFTPRLGKIQGFAKSLRKPKSKMAGHLELLTHSTVSFSRGRGNIDTIVGAQTVNTFLPIKNDLWLTSCGLYVSELIHQFTAEHQANFGLFRLLVDTLDRLCRAENKELVLRCFELHMLESAGYRPQLRECVVCHKTLEQTNNYFSPAAGGMLCPNCSTSQPFAYTLSVNAQKVLRLLQGEDFSAATRVKVDTTLGREIENAIGGYLKYLLEKDIKSATWLDTLREQRLHFKQTP
ncbi:MAG: DNA repair protein RecO [Chloroflexi bacterium RBG_13_51_18]|nr:MAG: DNA repair protein RecO [Chloroflexi bacterium RBG_13_51_18]